MTDNHDGRRRIDRLLAPGFTDRLAELDDGELLKDRDEAVAEEADLSFVRKTLQGRLDLLEFEQQRRAGAVDGDPPLGSLHDDGQLVRALTRVLTSHPPHDIPHAGTGQPTSVGEHRRAAEQAVADVRISDPDHLDDAELGAAITRLSGLEARVSESRRRVQVVADALSGEVARRVEAGRVPAEVLQPDE